MKKAFKRVSCLLLSFLLLSSIICANAASARSSSSLRYYSANLTAAENGKIFLDASVTGRTPCSKIGISMAYIYESDDGGKTFSRCATYYSSDYPAMMGSGLKYSFTPISFTGTIGHQYKATVLCRAVSDLGDDTKSYETRIVTAHR